MPEAMKCVKRPLSTAPGCHCPDCMRVKARLSKAYRCNMSLPPARLDEAIERLDYWTHELRYTREAISSAAGVAPGTASRWLAARRHGRRPEIRRGWCEAILNAGEPTIGRMRADVSTRMLRALARLGWSCEELGRRLRVSETGLSHVRRGDNPLIDVWLRNKIVAIYNELQDQWSAAPRASIVAARAERLGWLAPAAWEDIHDLSERPSARRRRRASETALDMTAIERRLAGGKEACDADGELIPLTTREARQFVAIAILRGMPLGAITTLGVSPWHKHLRYDIRWATPATTQFYAVRTAAGWSYPDEQREAA